MSTARAIASGLLVVGLCGCTGGSNERPALKPSPAASESLADAEPGLRPPDESSANAGPPAAEPSVAEPSHAAAASIVAGMVRIEASPSNPAFWMDRDEVGLESFRACIAAGVCETPELQLQSQSPHPNGPASTDPGQAEAYCGWQGKRLPTIDEWLWAARGRDEQRTFPWGEDGPDFTRMFAADDLHNPGRIVGTSVVDASHVKLIDDEGIRRRLWVHLPTDRAARPLGSSRDGIRNLLGNVQEAVTTEAGAPAYIGGGYLYRLPTHPDVNRTASDVAGHLMSPKDARRPHGYDFDGGYGVRCVSDERPVGEATLPEVHHQAGLARHSIPGTRRHLEAKRLCERSRLEGSKWAVPTQEQLEKVANSLLDRGPYWTLGGDLWIRAGASVEVPPGTSTGFALCVTEQR